MLAFGPYGAMPDPSEGYAIFNITSFNEQLLRLPGIIVDLPEAVQYSDDVALAFDKWYYEYMVTNPVAFGSMMTILMTLYNESRVYVCISDYVDSFINTINESFIKILQQRYGLRCVRVNVVQTLRHITGWMYSMLIENGIPDLLEKE